MPVVVDTNVLVYAERLNDLGRADRAREVLERLVDQIVIPTQVLGEFYRMLRRKGRRSDAEAALAIDQWTAPLATTGTTTDAFRDAMRLAGQHGLDIHDAVILAVSAEARCTLLLSEDMQDGFVWRGTTIANPFAPIPHPLLASALAEARLS